MARYSFIVALFTLAVALGRVTSFTASSGEYYWLPAIEMQMTM
jgi:hypothetical protein